MRWAAGAVVAVVLSGCAEGPPRIDASRLRACPSARNDEFDWPLGRWLGIAGLPGAVPSDAYVHALDPDRLDGSPLGNARATHDGSFALTVETPRTLRVVLGMGRSHDPERDIVIERPSCPGCPEWTEAEALLSNSNVLQDVDDPERFIATVSIHALAGGLLAIGNEFTQQTWEGSLDDDGRVAMRIRAHVGDALLFVPRSSEGAAFPCLFAL